MVVMRAAPLGAGPARALASWPVLASGGLPALGAGWAIATGVPREQLARGGVVRSSQPLSTRRPMCRVEFSGPRLPAALAMEALQARASKSTHFGKVTVIMKAIVCSGDVTDSDVPQTNFINCQ